MQLCYFKGMNSIKSPGQLATELLHFFEARQMQSPSEIARATGINQSQVYRNLKCRPKRVSKTLIALCKYANISLTLAVPDPSESRILMEALSSVWDGSDTHAHRLAELLFAHQRASV